MDRVLRQQIEERVVTITEVDLPTVIMQDQFNTTLYLSLQFVDPVFVVPEVGDTWTVKRSGGDWFLNKRLNKVGFDLDPGDVIIDGKVVKLNGQISLEPTDEPSDDSIDYRTSKVWFDGANINIKSKDINGVITTAVLNNPEPVAPPHIVENEGAPVTPREELNFTGSGVNVADTGGKTVVSIPPAGVIYYTVGGVDIPIVGGGTGASTAAGARANLGISEELLSSGTLGSPGTGWDITGISQAYKHLRMKIIGQTSDAAVQDVQVIFNNDTSSTYDISLIQGAGTTSAFVDVLASANAILFRMPPSSATGMPGVYTLDIPFYTNTTFHKMMYSSGGFSDSTSANHTFQRFITGKWRNTAAISRITLTMGTGNFVTGSAYSLYGIL